jgi:hypothetical protein
VVTIWKSIEHAHAVENLFPDNIFNALGDEYHFFVNCKINRKDRNVGV